MSLDRIRVSLANGSTVSVLSFPGKLTSEGLASSAVSDSISTKDYEKNSYCVVLKVLIVVMKAISCELKLSQGFSLCLGTFS